MIKLFIFLATSVQASYAVDFKCPDKIDTQQTLVSPQDKAWTPMVDTINGTQNLENIGVFDGHPKEGASLVPDNEQSKKDPYWTFSIPRERPIWIACEYRQSKIRLIRQLPDTVKKCSLHYVEKGQHSIDRLSCSP